jgi:hypothetical protein
MSKIICELKHYYYAVLRIRDVLSRIPDPNIFQSQIPEPDPNVFHPGSWILQKEGLKMKLPIFLLFLVLGASLFSQKYIFIPYPDPGYRS